MPPPPCCVMPHGWTDRKKTRRAMPRRLDRHSDLSDKLHRQSWWSPAALCRGLPWSCPPAMVELGGLLGVVRGVHCFQIYFSLKIHPSNNGSGDDLLLNVEASNCGDVGADFCVSYLPVLLHNRRPLSLRAQLLFVG